MIVLSTSAETTIAPNQSVIFDTVIMHTGRAECHRDNTSSVKLCCQGIYSLQFCGNVAGETAVPLQLQLQTGGENLPETLMISTPSAPNTFNSVSAGTRYPNCCGDYDRVTVTNTGENPVILSAGCSLLIQRVA